MQLLRNARLFRRLALLWLGLALGVAIAAPLANPTSMEVICSTSGVTVVSLDDRAPSGDTSELHCPLCLPLSAPPAVVLQFSPPQIELSIAQSTRESAKLQIPLGKPWQARAPPQPQV